MRTKTLTQSTGRLLTVVALVVMGYGCTSGLSREECQVVNWRDIGYEDGLEGRTQAKIAQHRKACAKYGVAMDLSDYREGWDEGVQRYCQSGNGYRRGRSGSPYNAVCPPALEPAFLQAYREGRQLYELQVEVRRLEHTLNYRHKRLAEIESAIVDTGVDLVTPGASTEQRVVMLDELRQLEKERSSIRDEIPALQYELDRQQEALAVASAAKKY